MNIYIYSDESGVFDKVHNKAYVFGGIIALGNESKENYSRRYAAVEKIVRHKMKKDMDFELKATNVSNAMKLKLFRSLNSVYKFCVIIEQERVIDSIFNDKKSKQRYLDYVYKIGTKRALEDLIARDIISPNEIENIYFYVDEHTTATNGQYELKEALEQELKHGTTNYTSMTFYPPLFPTLKSVNVSFCNSKKNLLVRSADIVANRIYFLHITNQKEELDAIKNLHILYQP